MGVFNFCFSLTDVVLIICKWRVTSRVKTDFAASFGTLGGVIGNCKLPVEEIRMRKSIARDHALPSCSLHCCPLPPSALLLQPSTISLAGNVIRQDYWYPVTQSEVVTSIEQQKEEVNEYVHLLPTSLLITFKDGECDYLFRHCNTYLLVAHAIYPTSQKMHHRAYLLVRFYDIVSKQ